MQKCLLGQRAPLSICGESERENVNHGGGRICGIWQKVLGSPRFCSNTLPQTDHSCDSLAFCFGSTEIRSRDFLARRLWLGIWVRRALMDMAYLDSGSCWPPPGQPLLSPLALGHSVISQETTLAASAVTGLSLLCLLQVTSLALLKSLRSSPMTLSHLLYPGPHTPSSQAKVSHLYREPCHRP